jgi:hypothetical protein
MTSRRSPGRLGYAGGALFLLLTGCSSPTGTLSGTVRYQGAILPGGSILLYCEDQQILRGVIGEDGTYTITDVPPGKVVVTVQSMPRVPEGMQLKQKLPPTTADGPRPPAEGAYAKHRPTQIPRRYAAREESGLHIVINCGPQHYDIDLRP